MLNFFLEKDFFWLQQYKDMNKIYTDAQLHAKYLDDLIALCKEKNIKIYGKPTKRELIHSLLIVQSYQVLTLF